MRMVGFIALHVVAFIVILALLGRAYAGDPTPLIQGKIPYLLENQKIVLITEGYTGNMASFKLVDHDPPVPDHPNNCTGSPNVYRFRVVHYETGTVVSVRPNYVRGDDVPVYIRFAGNYYVQWQCEPESEWFNGWETDDHHLGSWYYARLKPAGEGTIE